MKRRRKNHYESEKINKVNEWSTIKERRREMCGIMSTIDFSLRLDAFYGCIVIFLYGGDKYCSIICFYDHLHCVHCALKAVGSK